MEQNEKTTREEIIDLVKESVINFIQWVKPSPGDPLYLKIAKTILKIPVALFVIMISPVLLVLLGIIFTVLL